MHDTFGNSFVIEVCDLLAKDEILEQGGPAITRFERILIVVDANALIGCEKFAGSVFSGFCQIMQLDIVRAVSSILGFIGCLIGPFSLQS